MKRILPPLFLIIFMLTACAPRLEPGADFSNSDLTDQDMMNADLHDINFSGSDLRNVNLSHANLTSANLKNSDLSKAVLSYAVLQNASLHDANLKEAILIEADLSGANLQGTNLSGADLSAANLKNADLGSSTLIGVNLKDANLNKAILNDADLSNANLKNANLSDAYLKGANLLDVDLSGANLKNADLVDTNLKGANLLGADLSNADLKNADLSGLLISECTLKDVNLDSADLSGAELKNVDLSHVNFLGANLKETNLSGLNLSECNLVGADLSGTNLSGADLRNANLSSADLSDADLSGTDLSEAIMINCTGLTGEMIKSSANYVGLRLDSDDAIREAFKKVCHRGVGVSQAAGYNPTTLSPIITFSYPLNGQTILEKLPSSWLAKAIQFTEFVVCVNEENILLETCEYMGPDIERYQPVVTVKIVYALSGQTLASKTFEGTIPRECKQTETYNLTRLEGEFNNWDTIIEWISIFVNPNDDGVTDTPTHSSTSTPSETFEYVVQAEDNCASISEKFDVDVETLLQLNNLDGSCILIPGTIILIPPPE